jgi:hypothetical protein
MDTLKSSTRNKSVLTSHLAEEDPEPISTTKEASPAPARNHNPVIQVVPPVSAQKILVVPAPQTPVPAPRKLEPDEPEKKEDEKEKAKEGSKLTRKLKQLRKGEIFKRVSCNVCGPSIHPLGTTALGEPWPPRLIVGFRNKLFLRCGVVSPTPNPQPGGPGYPFSSGSSCLTCLAWKALPAAYATASIAVGVM